MTQPISTSQPLTSAAVSGETPAQATDSVNADFTTFLTLLTTQLRNQDPLKPVDSTEFVAQLASFSTVEQQTRTNDLLEDILTATGTAATLSDAASWIGLEVSAPGSARFDGETPVAFFVNPPAGAQSAEMIVYNVSEQPVARMSVAPDAQNLGWDGLDSTGVPAPAGSYRAEVTYAVAGDAATQPAQPYVRVDEVRLIDGAPVLLLESGASVAIDDVGAVRRPSAG